MFLVGCCVKSLSGDHLLRPQTDFCLIFPPLIHSPKRREIVPPHTIGRGQFSSQNLPLSPTLYFGWLSYVFSSIGGRPRPPIVFFYFPFPESNFHPKRRVIVLPKRSTAAESRKKYLPIPLLLPFFGWLLHWLG